MSSLISDDQMIKYRNIMKYGKTFVTSLWFFAPKIIDCNNKCHKAESGMKNLINPLSTAIRGQSPWLVLSVSRIVPWEMAKASSKYAEINCWSLSWSPRHGSNKQEAIWGQSQLRYLMLQLSIVAEVVCFDFSLKPRGGGALLPFLGKHVRPAPLKDNPIWVVPKLKKHTPSRLTDSETHPFWHHFN